MSTVLDEPAAAAMEGAPEWKVDKLGREYTNRPPGRSGVILRQGEETIDQARERDAKGPAKKAPKRKTERKPPAPTEISMKELEHQLRQALEAPAYLAAMREDAWGVQHFQQQAPRLARNMVACAEGNEWFRAKLIAAMAGEGVLVNVMMFASLGAAAFAYVIPPIVHYLNPPFIPDRAGELIRARYNIPDPPLEYTGAVPEPPTPATAPAEPAPAAFAG